MHVIYINYAKIQIWIYDFWIIKRKSYESLLVEITDYISYSCNESIVSKYLERIEEQLTIHPHLPAQTVEGVWHSNKHNVVHPKHQHQHKRGFGKLPGQIEMKMFCQLKGNMLFNDTLQTCMNFFSLWNTKTDLRCNHIYLCTAKFSGWNTLISIAISMIWNFILGKWGKKIPHANSHWIQVWTCKFV